MALDTQLPFDSLAEGEEQPSKTYRLDLDGKRIRDSVDGLEAVKQAIDKALRTARYKNLIYDSDYGSELLSVMLSQGTREMIETSFPKLIEEALSGDARILGVSGFSYEYGKDSVTVRFTAETIFGSVETEYGK
jgi:hypothetical protein